MPFDKRRNGLVLGEGAGVMVFEDMEHARQRKAKIYGEIIGFARTFDPGKSIKDYSKTSEAARTMDLALKDAKLKPTDIDLICASANSSRIGDRLETQAIKKVFGKRASRIPITAVKSMLGEGYSVSGSFQAMAALLAIKKGIIPPTINYQQADRACDLNYIANKSKRMKVKKVMINSFSPHGNNTSLIIAKI